MLDPKLQVHSETGGVVEKICIVRAKSRFARPTSGGWGDIMVNFYFADDPNAHICELQLVHGQLYNVRKKMGAHETYKDFRAAAELCETLGLDVEEGGDACVMNALVWKGRKKSTAVVRDPSALIHDSVLSKIAILERELECEREKVSALEARAEVQDQKIFELGALEARAKAQETKVFD